MTSRKRLNVETEHAVRGLWLVKVPKYLSEIWEANSGQDVGKLKLGNQNAKQSGPEVNFSQANNVFQITLISRIDLNKSVPGKSSGSTVPTEHSFMLNDVRAQNMIVMMEDKTELNEHAGHKSGKLKIEGRVVKRADCTPVAGSDVYMKMKIAQIRKNMQPKRSVELLSKAVVTHKPINIHEEEFIRQKQKKEGAKMVRADRDVVVNLLFQAFEKHQYYRLQDLQQLTQQPANYIKELLQEIAVYNTAHPHKNMWELKSEYRNYKST